MLCQKKKGIACKKMLQSIYNFIFRLSVFVLKCGRIPRHVGFTPDSNRTFSKKFGITINEVYHMGGKVILEQIKLALLLEISYFSIYIFSVSNHSRLEEEVLPIWDTMEFVVNELLTDSMNCRIKFVGNRPVLPKKLQTIFNEAEVKTKNNSGTRIIFCVSYSGKQELVDAVLKMYKKYQSGILNLKNITELVIDEHMYSNNPNTDLIIRTSNTTRLSDFLIWQVSNGMQHYSGGSCPEFTKWDFLKAVFLWQCHLRKNKNQKLP